MDSEILKHRSKNLAYEVTSLHRCEDEPIAFCGAIQSSGYMIVADCDSLLIRAISRNWDDFLEDSSATDWLGKPLKKLVDIIDGDHLLGTDVCQLIANERIKVSARGANQLFKNGNRSPEVTAGHCVHVGSSILIEFERSVPSPDNYPVAGIRDLVFNLKSSESIETASQHTADVIRKLSGFDRVMIYRFDSKWNGDVIAESLESGIDSFVGLRYPASDIPPQARELFFRNRSRMIIDVQSEPSPLIASGFHPGEIDLSLAMLRAVSPIHLQYLSNMGVSASFSAPIRVNDKLWGLIACHHYSGPKHPNAEIRSAFELAAQITSGKISDLVARRRLSIKNETLEFTQTLLTQVSNGSAPLDSFAKSASTLMRLTEATAAYIKIGEHELLLGDAPRSQTVQALRTHLAKKEALTIWATDSLSSEMGTPLDPKACGVLAVPFSLGFEDCLIWFRPEETQEVRWGGQPKTKTDYDPQSIERLLPRNSFHEWREKLQGYSRPWSEADNECAQYFLFGFVQGIFAKAQTLAVAYKELERVTNAKDEFISMVSHELRTPLGIIMGWIEILKEYPQANSIARDAVEIIDRNAKTQIALINDLLDVSRINSGKMRLDPRPNVDIPGLLNDIVDGLQTTAISKAIRLSLESPPTATIMADPERLRQMVWNLVTNAIKFTPKGGKVDVSLVVHRSNIEIRVADNGHGIDPVKLEAVFGRFVQSAIDDAKLGGLGLGLSIVRALAELHGGRVEAFSEGVGRGSRFTIILPVYALKEETAPVAGIEIPMKPLSQTLKDLKILIAEDQVDSLRALSILLERQGAIVTAAHDGAQALKILKTKKFDLILSDIGMPELDGYGLIKAWRQEEEKFKIPQIPAIALTAYASSKDRTQALSAGFQSHIPKPVDREELMAVVESLGLARKS